MKTKKLLLYTAALFFIVLGSLYFGLRTKKAAQEKATNWVNHNGGFLVLKPHPWSKRIPKKFEFLNRLLRDRVVNLGLAPNSPIPFANEGDNSPLSNYTPIDDISLIRHLTSLEMISINDLSVSDISPLKNLKNLTSLDLAFTRVKDLTPIKGLSQLTDLKLTCTLVEDLTPLKGLTKLESLHLELSNITNLEPLYGLKNLKEISIKATPLTFEQINKLKIKLPGCIIKSDFDVNPNNDYSYINDFLKREIGHFSVFETQRMNQIHIPLIEISMTKNDHGVPPIIYRSQDSPQEQAKDFINYYFYNATIGEIIHTICVAKGLKYKIEKHSIRIYHPSALSSEERSRSNINLNEKEIPRPQYTDLTKEFWAINIPKIKFEESDFNNVFEFLKTVCTGIDIEKELPFNFIAGFYPRKKITLERENISLKKLLDEICKKFDINYKINSQTVYFRPNK